MTLRTVLQTSHFNPPIIVSTTYHNHGHVQLIGRRHATAVIAGVQESGIRPGWDIEQFMLEFGDLMIVRAPNSGGYSPRKMARQTLEFLRDYDEVTLVGISAGAKVAQEIIRRAKRLGLKIKFRLVLDSAPSRVGTLAKGLQWPARFAVVVPYIPASRRFSQRLYKKLNGATVENLPPYSPNLTPDQMDALRRHQRYTLEHPFGMYIAATRALVLAPDPSTILSGIPTAFICSRNDEVVDTRQAYQDWRDVIQTPTSPVTRYVVVNSKAHVDHSFFPAEWLEGYKAVYRELGITRLN